MKWLLLTAGLGLAGCEQAAADQAPVSATAAPTRSADQDLGALLAKQLQCAERPSAGELTVRLADEGFIAAEMDEAIDSVSCFYLKKPLQVPAEREPSRTLTPKAFCVVDMEFADFEKHPKLFWRGPGTAPPQTVEIYVDAEPSEIYAWMKANDSRMDAERISGDESTLGAVAPVSALWAVSCKS